MHTLATSMKQQNLLHMHPAIDQNPKDVYELPFRRECSIDESNSNETPFAKSLRRTHRVYFLLIRKLRRK